MTQIRSFRALPFLLALSTCAQDAELDPPELYAHEAPLAASVDLSRGQRRSLIEGIVGAENQLFTTDGRLFVSGDEGVFEVVQQAAAYSSRKLPAQASCQFGGLTEHANTLYANCYDMASANASVYAAPLTAAPQLRAIHPLPGVALANGLTSDEDGQLYVASSFDGAILRLQLDPSDPLRVSAQQTWLPNSGLMTNGIKYFDGELFWTAFTDVNSVTIQGNGKPGLRRNLSGALTFFDDLYVDDAGFLVDDYLNGRVLSLNPAGQHQSATPFGLFNGPSSVQPAQGRLGLSATALVVTERGANRVSVYEP